MNNSFSVNFSFITSLFKSISAFSNVLLVVVSIWRSLFFKAFITPFEIFISNYLKVILDKSASEIRPLKSYFTLSEEMYYSPVYLKIYNNIFYITNKTDK